MKEPRFHFFLLLCWATAASLPADAAIQQPGTSAALQWQVKARNQHQTEWYSVRQVTNSITRRVRQVTNSYIEVATGLNTLDSTTGQWSPSDSSFQITRRGAESTRGSHSVLLAPDIATAGSISVSRGGVTTRSHPLSIGYYDPVDGRSVRLAEITNAIGCLVRSNEVFYSNCFNGLRASIRIRNSKAGVSQDLLLHEQPRLSPADFGFSKLSRLELFTEFVGETPMPQATPRTIEAQSDPVMRQRMREPDFKDNTLSFNAAMQMMPGRAFLASRRVVQAGARSRRESAPVGKRFEIIDNRRILIEAVPIAYVENLLSSLPPASLQAAVTNAAVLPLRKPFEPDEKVIRRLPAKLLASRDGDSAKMESALFSPVAHSNTVSAIGVRKEVGELAKVASDSKSPSANVGDAIPETLILDYDLVDSHPNGAMVFRGDTTYLVTGEVWLQGTTTFCGGTVIKYVELDQDFGSGYGSGNGGQTYSILYVNGPVVCNTDPYHPAVFTSAYDNSVGEIISTETSPTYFFQALAINNNVTTTLSNIQVRYALYGLHTAFSTVNLRHAQFDHCSTAFYPEWCRWNVGNVLVHDSDTVFSGGSYQLWATNITVDDCSGSLLTTWGSPSQSSAHIYNHILAGVNNLGSVGTSFSNLGVNDLVSSSGLFQTVGGGRHYLANNSPYRDSAATAITQPDLLAELRQMTTYPPIPLSGELNLPLTLSRVARRDNDASIDRGYHYPAMDWLITGLDVKAGPLVVTNGAAIGLSSTDGNLNYCIHLSGTELRSSGSPLDMNRFFIAPAVQEDPPLTGQYGSPPLFTDDPSGVAVPRARFKFSEISGMGGATLINRGDNYLFDYEISHSRIQGLLIYLTLYGNQGRTLGWTNNLFNQCDTSLNLQQPGWVNLYNNLFLDGTLALVTDQSGAWSIHDNIFDHMGLSAGGVQILNITYNAFVATTPFAGTGTPIYSLTTLPYVSGTLGSYYLPPLISGQANPLINNGSRSASAAGLYHFTTLSPAQTKEGLDGGAPIPYQVDVGLHYVALNNLGLPFDFDGDGFPDYFEDADGNGITNGNETNWQIYNSPYGGTGITGLMVFRPREN